MNQTERRRYLIDRLLEEEPQYKKIQIPDNTTEQKQLLRSLAGLSTSAGFTYSGARFDQFFRYVFRRLLSL